MKRSLFLASHKGMKKISDVTLALGWGGKFLVLGFAVKIVYDIIHGGSMFYLLTGSLYYGFIGLLIVYAVCKVPHGRRIFREMEESITFLFAERFGYKEIKYSNGKRISNFLFSDPNVNRAFGLGFAVTVLLMFRFDMPLRSTFHFTVLGSIPGALVAFKTIEMRSETSSKIVLFGLVTRNAFFLGGLLGFITEIIQGVMGGQQKIEFDDIGIGVVSSVLTAIAFYAYLVGGAQKRKRVFVKLAML